MDHSAFYIYLKSRLQAAKCEKKVQQSAIIYNILQKLTSKYTYLFVHSAFYIQLKSRLQAAKCEKKVQRRAIVYNIYCKNRPFTLAKNNSNECPDFHNDNKYKLILNQFTHFCTHKILGRLIVDITHRLTQK